MKICFTELMLELSRALDYVEIDLVGVQTNHSKRVAYLCALLGKYAGMSNKEYLDLATYAVLHDNALSEFLQIEFLNTGELIRDIENDKIGVHCAIGEENIKGFPFFRKMENVILYHHENADGTGPFQKKEGEINLYASLIHLADQIDANFSMKNMDDRKWNDIQNYVTTNIGKLFGEKESTLFLSHIKKEDLTNLNDDTLDQALEGVLDYVYQEFTPEQLIHIGGIFARIVDYKSTFTSDHSLGIAQKAYFMGTYYGYAEEKCAKLYLAGALHDIGKLAVEVSILEKPDKLESGEFEHMKQHAVITREILSRIRGMEEICAWASSHHEKLNGNGYPFGYKDSQLEPLERLMGCLDIYQALREERPYKESKSHEDTMKIMGHMVENGFIDKNITKDINDAFINYESI